MLDTYIDVDRGAIFIGESGTGKVRTSPMCTATPPPPSLYAQASPAPARSAPAHPHMCTANPPPVAGVSARAQASPAPARSSSPASLRASARVRTRVRMRTSAGPQTGTRGHTGERARRMRQRRGGGLPSRRGRNSRPSSPPPPISHVCPLPLSLGSRFSPHSSTPHPQPNPPLIQPRGSLSKSPSSLLLLHPWLTHRVAAVGHRRRRPCQPLRSRQVPRQGRKSPPHTPAPPREAHPPPHTAPACRTAPYMRYLFCRPPAFPPARLTPLLFTFAERALSARRTSAGERGGAGGPAGVGPADQARGRGGGRAEAVTVPEQGDRAPANHLRRRRPDGATRPRLFFCLSRLWGPRVGVCVGCLQVPGKLLPFTINFSAQTSSPRTQEMLELRLDKKRKGDARALAHTQTHACWHSCASTRRERVMRTRAHSHTHKLTHGKRGGRKGKAWWRGAGAVAK